MAVGARKALLEHRRDWTGLRFLGCDGLPEGGQRLVAQGLLAATVVTPSNTGPALEIVARWLHTKRDAAPRGPAGPAVAPAGGSDPAAGQPLMAKQARAPVPPGRRGTAGLPEASRRDGRGVRGRARGAARGPPASAEEAAEEGGARPDSAQAEAGRVGPGAGEGSPSASPRPRPSASRRARGRRPSPARGSTWRPPGGSGCPASAPSRTPSSSSAARSRSRARWRRREAGSRPTAATGSSSTAAASSGGPRRATRARTRPTPSTSRAGSCPART